MARAVGQNTRNNDPSKIGPPVWLPLKDVLSRWCDRYGSIEAARDNLQGLLRSAPSLLLQVSFDGKEIPTVKNPEFWNDRDLSVQTDIHGIDSLLVPSPDDEPWVSDWQFFVRAVNVERWEGLYPALAEPEPAPDKEPTLKKKRRRAKSVKPRGRKAKILPRLINAMKNDVSEGKMSLDQLKDMSDKELAHKYSAKRERARAARQSVIADERKKIITDKYRQSPTKNN